MASITGANAVVMLSVVGLFPVPQQLQGFAADDVFDTDALESAEVQMGVDGHMAAGFVHVPVRQNYALMADSASNFIFDTWWGAQQQAREVFFANGIVMLTAVNTKWTLTRGVLSSFKPIPDVKKLIASRKFAITWQSVIASAS